VEQNTGGGDMTSNVRRSAWKKLGVAFAVAMVAFGEATTALAHSNGRIELFIARLEVAPAPGGVALSATMSDLDSAEPASGFGVSARAVNAAGQALGPIQLVEPQTSGTVNPGARGHYQGVLPLGPGTWQITATSEQGQSAIPALAGHSKTVMVTIGQAGTVHTSTGGGSTSRALLIGVSLALLAVLGVGLALLAHRRRRVRRA
jgi:hypothetical protein